MLQRKELPLQSLYDNCAQPGEWCLLWITYRALFLGANLFNIYQNAFKFSQKKKQILAPALFSIWSLYKISIFRVFFVAK